MTAAGCYRPTRSPESAQTELRSQAGRQFDPAVVDTFLKELDAPPSSTDHNTSQAEARAALAHEVVSNVNGLLQAAAQ
jgi:response regulator RpfG family c-di-GMP phosphodiesterase